MTLIVGGIEGTTGWMCADAAITSQTADVRARAYRPKIEAVGKSGLLGFAGSVHLGLKAFAATAKLEPGEQTIATLMELHRKSWSPGKKKYEVDFLYCFLERGAPRLVRIADGKVDHSTSFFIGDQMAYEKFQEIRLSRAGEHAPDAIHTFMSAGYRDEVVPEGLNTAVHTMLAQFATTSDRSVGGWASPHMLTPSGPSMCTYGYSVTDPITRILATGQEVPHGSAEGGGFSLSFCPLRELDGIVVYWLQKPGGKVFVRVGETYEYDEYDFSGTPEQFKTAVMEKLGRSADLWFGGSNVEQPDQVDVIRDENGEARMFVAKSGNTMSFSWVNGPTSSFRSLKRMDIDSLPDKERARFLEARGMKVSVSDDAEVIKFSSSNGELSLTAAEADALISALAIARMKLKQEVPFELAPDTKLEAILNPTWRTRAPPHPAVPGPLLVLRHPGHGWQPFILPKEEARALGEWLTTYVEQAPAQPHKDDAAP